MSVVLPPLLYSAALDFSFPTFLRNIRPILGLGVGLVVITALAVAGVASWLIPSLTFGTALILGAVVAPPDAVTAVAVGRKTGAAEEGDGHPDRREPGQRRGRTVPVLHRGGPGRRQPSVHREPGAAVQLQRCARAARRGRAGLHHAVDPPPARASRFGNHPGSGGAVRGVHLRRAPARLWGAGGGGRRICGRPRLAGSRLSDPAAGAVRVELGRRHARGVRVRLHRAAAAVHSRRPAPRARIAGRGGAGVGRGAGRGVGDPACMRLLDVRPRCVVPACRKSAQRAGARPGFSRRARQRGNAGGRWRHSSIAAH